MAQSKIRRRGQIINKGPNKWQIRVFIGCDGATGKRKYRSETVHGIKSKAEKRLAAILHEMDTGGFASSSNMKLSEYIDKWLSEAAEQSLSPNTFDEYKGLLNRYIIPKIGNKPLAGITAFEIQTLYNDMIRDGLSARTVRYTHAVLGSALKQAQKWRFINENPAVEIKLPQIQRKEMHPLNREQVVCFLEAAKSSHWHALFVLLVTSGMRPSEALGLKWGDIADGKAHIQRTLIYKGSDWYFGKTKTAKSRRVIRLSEKFLGSLDAHRETQDKEKEIAGADYIDRGLIFAKPNGDPIDRKVILRGHLKPILKKAGLPPVTLYDLRHTFATLLLAENVNPKFVAEILGHSSVVMTLDTYSHVLPHMQDDVIEIIDHMLS